MVDWYYYFPLAPNLLTTTPCFLKLTLDWSLCYNDKNDTIILICFHFILNSHHNCSIHPSRSLFIILFHFSYPFLCLLLLYNVHYYYINYIILILIYYSTSFWYIHNYLYIQMIINANPLVFILWGIYIISITNLQTTNKI